MRDDRDVIPKGLKAERLSIERGSTIIHAGLPLATPLELVNKRKTRAHRAPPGVAGLRGELPPRPAQVPVGAQRFAEQQRHAPQVRPDKKAPSPWDTAPPGVA